MRSAGEKKVDTVDGEMSSCKTSEDDALKSSPSAGAARLRTAMDESNPDIPVGGNPLSGANKMSKGATQKGSTSLFNAAYDVAIVGAAATGVMAARGIAAKY